MIQQQDPAVLQELKDKINRLYGKGTVFSGNERPEPVPVISTGSLLLDIATGIGGLPIGRIVEIISPESAGKTTVCLQTVAAAQKMGKLAAYIDMEHTLDLTYARQLGVDTDSLLISQPKHGEEALNIAKNLTESKRVAVIVVDSVSALVPKKELEGEVGDSNIGRQAWMMSQALRILTPMAQANGTMILFTNQIRIKVGTMYGSPETGSGGEALKFYASMRLDLRRTVDRENEGNKVRIRVIKNKLAVPYKEANVFLEWGRGVSRMAEVLALAVEDDIIHKAGSWYSYGSNRLGQGEEAVRGLLEDNPELYTEIEHKVLVNRGIDPGRK